MIFIDLTKETRKTFFGTNTFAAEIIQKPYEEKNNVFSKLFSSISRYVINGKISVNVFICLVT